MMTINTLPPDLRFASRWRDVDPLTSSETTVADLSDRAHLITSLAEVGSLTSASRLVLALDAWDEAFRNHGLISGNVYLASEASVPALAGVAGIRDENLEDIEKVDDILGELFDMELVYRFPVALKFRAEYGRERQFRLNCWGRRLAVRLSAVSAVGAFAATIRTYTSEHLGVHAEQYRAHMDILHDLDGNAPGAAWRSALSLPVGVLA